jgi:hypothetical protein
MAQTAGNANALSAGAKAVLMSPFSGPTNSPFDARVISSWPVDNDNVPVYANDPTNTSTGALNTGIGFGIGSLNVVNPTAPQSIKDAGFTDDYTPGVTLPSGVAATTAVLTAIGGGKSGAAADGIAPTVPYVAQPLLGFGNGGSRDAGAGPAFTGFGSKMVTAAGAVATGAVIETGFVNRTSRALVTGESAFGSATAASPAVT